MANERRLIDANKLREDWLLYGANENIYSTNDVLDSIDEAPTVDAVEVGYCRSCRYASDEQDNGWLWCDEWQSGSNCNGFCHKYERRCE